LSLTLTWLPRWRGTHGAQCPACVISTSASDAGGTDARSVGDDVDQLAALAGPELHHTVGEGEERVVAATADVDAGVKARAALAYRIDPAGTGGAAEGLDPEPLGVRVSAVSGGTATLGLDMEFLSSARSDGGDLHRRVALAVAPASPLVALRL